VYKVLNGAMFSSDRRDGPDGISADLASCLPFIKFLETACKSLPPQFIFKGKCMRGVKWVFPSPDNHDPENYFTEGRDLYFYELKSSLLAQTGRVY
jgi:hypothetical protein